jgi:hypothetical protein
MKKIKDKLQQRAKFNKGKRVGYAEGRPVVDRETGEIIPVLTPGMTSGRKVQQSKFEPVTVQTTAPVKATATTPTTLSVGTSSPAPVLAEEKIETNYSPNQKTSKDFRENLAVKDTRDYASMSDDEIKKLIPQISYGGPGNKQTVDIGQAQIDEFRLQKTDPQLFSQLMKDLSSGNALPENYDNPIAKRMAEKDQASRAKFAEFQRNNPYVPPTPKPAPDGTPENPFQMQSTPTTNKFPIGSDGEPIVQGEDDTKPYINIPGLPGYDPNSPTVYPPVNVPGGPYGGVPGGTPSPTPAPTPAPTPSPAMQDAKTTAEQIVAGEITPPQIAAPTPVEVGELGVAKELADRTPIVAEQIDAPKAPEAVTTGPTATVAAPEALTAAQMEAAQITEAPEVAVAEGEVRPEALAEAAQVERVAPIEAATVEIPEGALTERVVGTISPTAMAEAAQVAGTTLARVTRAKKQLRNAGVSEEDIATLGNDPESLEDRLMDLTEAQRGVIAGLPEEALVSNQLDSLLKGIEEGEIPTWARPAVASVEAMLAQRGMSASSVGRDALLNAIIQSAVPLAQSNAQAIQQSVGQQKSIEAQAEIQNAQFRQQTALDNAGKVFQMDMAQFSSDQQIALSNSKFLQTVGLTEANNRQQATIQNAILMSQANLAEADFYQKAQINNANAFLQMDLSNLNNKQQANLLKAQQAQQTLLSNQAATNASRQFNAASENQTQQFMSNLSTQVELQNAQQQNTMAQFNTQQINARQALEFQVEADLEKANAAMINNINQFNAQVEFDRDKFNVANAQAIEQSNLAWRRQANTINTAAANQAAMQNAQNAFNMSSQAQSFLWQELRDQANYTWQSGENEENRKAQLYAQALANEGGSAKDWSSNVGSVGTLINSLFGKG